MSRRPVGSIRWRSPGVARVELQAGFDPVTGKPRRLSKTVHGTEADAERALAQMLIDIGQVPSGKAIKLSEYLEDLYYPFLKGHVRRETREGYEAKLDRHVTPTLGHVRLVDLEPYSLDVWRDALIGKMSKRSALNVYRAFDTALNRAVKWRLIQVNPLKAVDVPRPELRDVDTLTAKEAVAYLKAFRGHVIEPIVILAIGAGLRPCELCGLTWAEVDLKSKRVHVVRGLHQRKSDVWMEEPKSLRSRREVSLPDWAVVALRPLKGIGAIVSEAGGHMAPNTVQRLYRAQIASESLRKVPMRDLRHSHATLLLEAGVDVVTVSRRLGHSTVAITDAYYLHPKQSADRKAADALADLMAGKGVKRELA